MPSLSRASSTAIQRDPDVYSAFAVRVRKTLSAVPEHSHSTDETAHPTGSESPAPRREWTITTERGVTVHGYHPAWDQADPSAHDIPANRLEVYVSDVGHVRHWKGQTAASTNLPQDKGRYVGECDVLCPQMNLNPFSDDPAERIPYVAVEMAEGGDEWIDHLDPQGVADLAAKLRAQADRLENEVLPALVAARADWAANGNQK